MIHKQRSCLRVAGRINTGPAGACSPVRTCEAGAGNSAVSKRRVRFSDESDNLCNTDTACKIGASAPFDLCELTGEHESSMHAKTPCTFESKPTLSSTASLHMAELTCITDSKLSLAHKYEGLSSSTPPPSSPVSYGGRLASHHHQLHHGIKKKLTFPATDGSAARIRTRTKAHQYKVVPEVEGGFDVDHLAPHLDFALQAQKKRCAWITPQSDPAYVAYHDEEWGVPVHDDKRLFELFVFAGAQSEMAWSATVAKREAYRDAFGQFDANVLATIDPEKLLLKTHIEMMKSEARVHSIVSNAKLVVKIVEEFGSFDKYLWGFVGNKAIVGKHKQAGTIPTRTAKAEAISKDMQRRGFRNAGPMVIYSLMQAAGLANDHLLCCFRHAELCSSF